MNTLNQLLNQDPNPNSSPQRPPDSTPTPQPGSARLRYLIANELLPPYVTLLDREPDAIAPNTWSRQAANDWPRIARNLGMPKGSDPVPLDRGIAIRIGEQLLAFDLDVLWRYLNLYEEAHHALANT